MKIDKDIPIPQTRGHSIGQMEPGDSTFFPGIERSKLTSKYWYYADRYGWSFVTRTVTEAGIEGIRVWRVK